MDQEVQVNFTAELPNNIATKAYADGSRVKDLVYAVYNTDETKPVYEGKKALINGMASISLNLVSGKTYDFVFWADAPENNTYDVQFDGQTMTVNYANMKSNDENNDAFYAFRGGLTIDGAKSEKVLLVRPFAQINLGTDDLRLTEDKSFNITKSSMTATVANVLNFATGEVSGEASVTFAANALPAESPFPYAPADGSKKYDYLVMNYVLVGKGQATTTDCEFSIYEGENTTATNTIKVSNVPVKDNYRTNIYGSLITDPADVEVEVKPGIGDGENKEVTELPAKTPDEKFYEVLQKGKDVVLTGVEGRKNINFNGLTIAEDLNLTINAPVGEIILGGNNEAAAATSYTKSATTKPNIVISIAKDVAFPKFTFKGNVENYTIKGNLSTSKPLTQAISSLNDTADNADNVVGNDGVNIKNFTVKNVKAEGNGKLYLNGENITIQNCVATGLNQTFVFMSGFEGLNILDNEMSFAAPNANDTHKNAITLCWPRGGEINIKGNTINNAGKHAIFFGKANESDKNTPLVVENNTINGAVEDGVKTDNLNNVTVSGNAINVNEYGVRIDRLQAGDASFTVTGNAINTKANNGSYGIYINNRDNKTVNANITVNSNTAGADLAKTNRLFATNGNGMTLTGDYEFPYMLAEGIALSSNGKTWGVSNAEGMVKLSELAANAKPAEGKEFEVRLLDDINMAGKVWTPLAGHWVNFDGNNKTISNLNCGADSNGKSGFIGYLGASTIKNLTLENVTAAGEQVGIIAGLAEAGTIENVTIKGNNTVSYKDVEYYNEASGGVGAIFGVNTAGERTVGVTIAEGATITLNKTGIVTDIAAGNDYAMHAGVKVTDNGTIIVKADGIEINVKAKTAEISKAAGMVYANENLFSLNGYSYKLVEDIDMKGIEWTSNMNSQTDFTFDGAGYTISNWVTGERALFVPNGQYNYATVKNLKLENCKVDDAAATSGNVGAGLLFGWVDGGDSQIIIDNCHIEGGSVKGADYAAGFVGYCAEELTISNSSVKGMTITGAGSTGGVVGHLMSSDSKIENCEVSGCALEATETPKDWRVGAIAGTIQNIAEFKGITVGNNTYKMTNPTTEQISEVYGRIVGGILYIDGEATVNGDYIAAAIKNGIYNINLTEASYTATALGSVANGKTLTLKGVGAKNKVIFNVNQSNDVMLTVFDGGAKVTFENLTIQAPNGNPYRGFAGCNGTYKNCIINNTFTLGGASSFEGCEFNITGDAYNIWTWGANGTFSGCTFNCDAKAALVYADAAASNEVIFENCTFNDSGALNEAKAAIEIGESAYGPANYTVKISGCTVNGFSKTGKNGVPYEGDGYGTELWGNKNLMPKERLHVYVNGTQVY